MATPRSAGATSAISLPPIWMEPDGDVLKPRDEPEQRGLAAARGPDEHAELAVRDVEIDALDDIDRAKALLDVSQRDLRHGLTPPSRFEFKNNTSFRPKHREREAPFRQSPDIERGLAREQPRLAAGRARHGGSAMGARDAPRAGKAMGETQWRRLLGAAERGLGEENDDLVRRDDAPDMTAIDGFEMELAAAARGARASERLWSAIQPPSPARSASLMASGSSSTPR